MRKSTVTTEHDSAGEYEVEVFEAQEPKNIVFCSHGNGVRRWDGEEFYYKLAEHYPDSTFVLADQNQPKGSGCQLNDLKTMVARVQKQIDEAANSGTPVIVVGHSMGAGIASLLDVSKVTKMIFVAPSAGDITQLMVQRYGEDVLKGKKVTTKDGLDKYYPKAYIDSVRGVIWEEEYKKLLQRFNEVYVFESGDDQILGDRRLPLRDIDFKYYKIIPEAAHDFTGKPLEDLLVELDKLL